MIESIYRLYDKNFKKAKWRFFTSRGAHLNCAIMAMLYTHHRVGRFYK